MATTDATLADVTKMSRDDAKRFYMETYRVDAAEAEKMLMISHPHYRKDIIERPAPRQYNRKRTSSAAAGEPPVVPMAAKEHGTH